MNCSCCQRWNNYLQKTKTQYGSGNLDKKLNSPNIVERLFFQPLILQKLQSIQGAKAHVESGPFGLKKLVEDKPDIQPELINQPYIDPQLEAERQRIIRDVIERSSSTRNFVGNIAKKAENDVLKNGLNLASDVIGKVSNIPGLGPEVGLAGKAIGAIGKAIPDYKPVNIEAERQKIQSQYHVNGKGVVSNFFSNTFFGGRKGGEATVHKLIHEHGSAIIKSIATFRIPLSSAISKAGNLLTFGELEKQAQKLGYDKLFHLYLYIILSDGFEFGFEKNEVITVKPNYQGSITQDYLVVPGVAQRNLTLKAFIDNTLRLMGRDAFYEYSAFNHNCQDFVWNLLKANGLLNKQQEDFLLQNVKELNKKLPGYSSHAANFLTDIAQTYRLISGKGAR